jgi:hypothetical protein
LFFELLPAPRALYSAEVPSFYTMIAADPRPDVRVLELPFGVRDGASSIGDFSAIAQYYQTWHGKAIIGGYLSRVSERHKRMYQQLPVLGALMTLSEGHELSVLQEHQAREATDSFLERSRLGYVVIDDSRASPALVEFSVDLLGLTEIGHDHTRRLFITRRGKRPEQ